MRQSEPPPACLSVLLETSCLGDGRAAAGIGRYARHLRHALEGMDGLDVRALDVGPPRSESRPGRFLHAQLPALRDSLRHHPHLVHGVGGEPVLGFPLSRQVVTIHDVELWRQPLPGGARGMAMRLHAAVQARLLRRCAAYIAVSQTSAEEAIATLNLDARRMHVIPLGVAPPFSSRPAAADAGVLRGLGLEREGYLIWTGSLRHHDPRKALDILVEAVPGGAGSLPLALVGAPGAEAERVRAVARKRGVKVTICGRLEDTALAALYRNAGCCVISSRHEGFGMPALEAMACGCAVVSTNGGNLETLVGGAGITVAVGDVDALGRGIRDVLHETRRREELRRRGLERAGGYTWEACAIATAGVYRQSARQTSRSATSA